VLVHAAEIIWDPEVPDGVNASHADVVVEMADHEDELGVMSESARKNVPAISSVDPDAIVVSAEVVKSVNEIAEKPLPITLEITVNVDEEICEKLISFSPYLFSSMLIENS
jgi:hypothetical protein